MKQSLLWRSTTKELEAGKPQGFSLLYELPQLGHRSLQTDANK
jgi:hypothetical protein